MIQSIIAKALNRLECILRYNYKQRIDYIFNKECTTLRLRTCSRTTGWDCNASLHTGTHWNKWQEGQNREASPMEPTTVLRQVNNLILATAVCNITDYSGTGLGKLSTHAHINYSYNCCSKLAHGTSEYTSLPTLVTHAHGKVFNIHFNPKKCKHLRAVWTANPAKHPKNPSLKVLQGNPVDSELFYRPEGSEEALGIPIVPHHESVRILGAQITTGTSQDSIASALTTKTRTITSGMASKRLTLQETTKVLHTAVFPAIAYPAKFTALNQRQYEAISSPTRQLHTVKRRAALYRASQLTCFFF